MIPVYEQQRRSIHNYIFHPVPSNWNCTTSCIYDPHISVAHIPPCRIRSRNPKAWLFAVLGAEHILRLLPKGTHDYEKFILPSEMAHYLRAARLDLRDLSGMSYNPLTGSYRLGSNVDVNYLAHACRAP